MQRASHAATRLERPRAWQALVMAWQEKQPQRKDYRRFRGGLCTSASLST